MNNGNITYRLIENYLTGKMSPDEKSAFEGRIKKSPELKKKVQAHQLADDLIIENRLGEVKNILGEYHSSHTRYSKWKKWFISGTLAILISGSLFFIVNNNEESQSRTGQTEEKSISSGLEIKDNVNPHSQLPETGGSQPEKNTTSAPAEPEQKQHIINNNRAAGMPSFEKMRRMPVGMLNEEPVERPEIILPENYKPLLFNKESLVKPCSSKKITADFNIFGSCPGDDNGSIGISGISGGYAPYQVYIYQGKDTFNNSNLNPGTYQVVIKDKVGCTQSFDNIKVPSLSCREEHAFNPFLGETLELPVNSGKGIFTVYDRAGNIFFKDEIPVSKKYEWNGRNRKGQLKAGYYIYSIEYSNDEVINGTISIIE